MSRYFNLRSDLKRTLFCEVSKLRPKLRQVTTILLILNMVHYTNANFCYFMKIKESKNTEKRFYC